MCNFYTRPGGNPQESRVCSQRGGRARILLLIE
jgi:hypothetical protein